MLKQINPSDEFAASRLVELLSPSTPWHRSLWTVGVSMSLAEVIEACQAVEAGTLSEAAVKRLASSCARTAGADPALTPHEKATLNEHLRNVPRPQGLAFFAIGQLKDRISRKYLLRWAALFRKQEVQDYEGVARSLSAYLLDAGFSAAFLHQWFKEHIYGQAKNLTLAELCEEAHAQLAGQKDKVFEVLTAFKNAPRSASGYPKGWLRADMVSKWLVENGYSTSGVRASGAVIVCVSSRDTYAAVDAATAIIDRYVARASIGSGQDLQPWPEIWVKGHAKPFRYVAKHRGVRVKALYREDQVFAGATNSNVDAAIELLAHLENSSPSAAIAGGWAAIEALLADPRDRAAAADNLAALVACSVPRAELTRLSFEIARQHDELAPQLKSCTSNRERAAIVAELIAIGHTLRLPHLTERAAVQRMQQLLGRPQAALKEIQLSVSDAFHRLYRQRNLILHGGITNSIALTASLRTASRVAGAGMDRVAHGFYVQNLRPLELAARARVGLELITAGNPRACVDLLDE